jgi:DNA mismatch repair ATPase MutS
MTLYIICGVSVLANLFLVWYLTKLLQKFIFISENISDLFLATKSFGVFVESLYSMDSYHGEPIIQELIHKLKEVIDEMEYFREIFEHTIDEELEEELNAAQEIEEE